MNNCNIHLKTISPRSRKEVDRETDSKGRLEIHLKILLILRLEIQQTDVEKGMESLWKFGKKFRTDKICW